MTSQEIISEIKSLKSELSAFNDQMASLRYGDLKASFLEQIRMVVGEEGKRTFRNDTSNLHSTSGCICKEECLRGLEKTADEAASSFMRDDLPNAKRILDEVEALIKGDRSPCQDEVCSQMAVETIRRVRAILEVYEALADRLGPGIEQGTENNKRYNNFTAEEMESVLDPLANAWRIRVLIVLRRGDRSLSEMGRAVELKTGHLQFHLRALVGAGLISLDRHRHRYILTERGAMALSYAEGMISMLGPLAASTANKGGRRSGVKKSNETQL